MSDAPPISVHILTWNAARTLGRALASVRGFQEILVIDGGSTDDTLAIASAAGARVIPQRSAEAQGKPLSDFSEARNRGLRETTLPWILVLDSDEVISPELREELARIARTETVPAAYGIPRRYVLPNGSIITNATTYPNEHLYFFHRDAIDRWIKPVHERVLLKPAVPVKHLHGASLAPLLSLDEYKLKNRQYIAIEAEQSRGKGWCFWLVHRLLHTLRSRAIATGKLLWIWLLPHRGKRLPLRHEMLRYWYAWQLVRETMPR